MSGFNAKYWGGPVKEKGIVLSSGVCDLCEVIHTEHLPKQSQMGWLLLGGLWLLCLTVPLVTCGD